MKTVRFNLAQLWAEVLMIKTPPREAKAVFFCESALYYAQLAGVDLESLQAQEATLFASSFKSAKLREATFENAILSECDFTDADLSRCTLAGAYLLLCTFDRSHLNGASINDKTRFSELDKFAWMKADFGRGDDIDSKLLSKLLAQVDVHVYRIEEQATELDMNQKEQTAAERAPEDTEHEKFKAAEIRVAKMDVDISKRPLHASISELLPELKSAHPTVHQYLMKTRPKLISRLEQLD